MTDNYYDNLGTVTYWWSHAMISDKTYQQLVNKCDFRRQKESNECESLYYYAMDKEFGNIDQYNIYAPPCNNSDGSTNSKATTTTRHSMRLPHQPYRSRRVYIPLEMLFSHFLFSLQQHFSLRKLIKKTLKKVV